MKINSATDQMKELVHLRIYLYSSRGKSHPSAAVSGGLAVSKMPRGDGVQCWPLRPWGDPRVQGRNAQLMGTRRVVWSI